MSSRRISIIGSVMHPSTPGNLIHWIDFADSSSITTVSGLISQANDKSGNGYHLAQGTSGNRPGYTAAGLNGRNIATFNGGPADSITTAGTGIGRNVAGLTAYVVFKHTAAPTARQNIYVVGSGGASTRLAIYGGHVSNKISVQGARLDADSNSLYSGTTGLGTGWHIATAVLDYTNGMLYGYLDGVAELSGALTSSGTSSNTASGSVSMSSLNPSFDLIGNIAEELTYNAVHDAATRGRVTNYLRNKWAL